MNSLIVVADNMFREWDYENAKFKLKVERMSSVSGFHLLSGITKNYMIS